MKFWIKLVFKTLAGGLGAFLLFSLISGLTNTSYNFIEYGRCNLIFVPVFYLVVLFLGSGLDDWGVLFFLVGAGFVFVSQIRPLLTVYFPEQANRFFRILVAVSLVLASIGIGLNVQKDYVIKKMYSEFCQAYNEQNYELAYSYFSPGYRDEVGINRFIKTLSGSYTGACDSDFAGTVIHYFNGAEIHPYSFTVSACHFLAGPELILVRIDGKWYFTGEHHWYMD